MTSFPRRCDSTPGGRTLHPPPPTAAAIWGDAAVVHVNATAELDHHEHIHRLVMTRRTGLRNRIRDELRVSDEFADLIVDEWEHEAMNRGLAPVDQPYWSEGARWIAKRFMNRVGLD
jgi:hypothetical protein